MKVFISYARIDKPYCVQIVHTLDVHTVWYDQRLYAGQQWWEEILRRLEWSECFVYLMSPESVQSEYCLQELDIAQKLQRPIIPVLIHPETEIPLAVADRQYVDMTRGLTADNVRVLLNSIYLAEHQLEYYGRTDDSQSWTIRVDEEQSPLTKSAQVIGLAAGALAEGQYDRAVFLLRQAKDNGVESRFINLERLLREAEHALEEQSRQREAMREYEQIYELFQYERTRPIALEAFAQFQVAFPEYDPQQINKHQAAHQASLEPVQVAIQTANLEPLPMLKWCPIPGGTVTVQDQSYQDEVVVVDDFWIAQYPVTNEQFDIFVDDPDGYANDRWWAFSDFAYDWFKSHREALAPHFKGKHRPRETVNWYEAIAFCNWLTHKIGHPVSLPTLAEWQRAALGDADSNYPWGNMYSFEYCNTRESELKMTTPVNRFPEGRSVYDVYDLAGNVWEWTRDRSSPESDEEEGKSAVIGGSFVSPCDRAKPSFRYFLKPEARYSSIGFRVAMLDPRNPLPDHLSQI